MITSDKVPSQSTPLPSTRARFLLVSPRPDEAVAAAEYQDFLRTTHLDPTDLDHLVISTCSVSLDEQVCRRYRGIFVGGSPLNVLDPQHSPFQQHVHEQLTMLSLVPVPVLFICFGAGFISWFLGGTISQTWAENSGKTRVELTEEGRRDPLTAHLPQTFTALTGHTEAIDVPACGTTVLATGPTCPIQALRVNDTTWATQFHAEMDRDGLVTRMGFYMDFGYFPREEYGNIVDSLEGVDTQYANTVLRNFISLAL